MTEKTLKKATELNENIKSLREKKEELEYAQKKSWGNFSEVISRNFFVEIREENGEKTNVVVSPEAARKALNYEIGSVSEILTKMIKEFDELC